MRGGELLNSSSPEKLFPWPESECELIKPTSEKPLKTSSTNTCPWSPMKTGRQNSPMPQSLGNLIPSKPLAIYTERKNILSDESADEGNLSALDTDAPKFPEFTDVLS
ncbi:uncharacterized protein LOC111706721 isoform X2 [Eurytemora carolleeae]|uniref:uncharacterized protein LOC111706721 isoform X2 n=1 Tax=Eurytemora carolleeae TaxID=1294199 RepID=UPI000C75F60A|nr:uncharacterized protein LOC111706721 isoform X2 [Eurytemora carolleeae]|eukprot:XP_023335419.1 uncharacterized protein LOC111706721 isoform X2 [Eurytemora affinis]